MQVATKTYFELYLPVHGFEKDSLSGLLHRAGCLGIQELNSGEWIIYLPGDWKPEDMEKLVRNLRQNNPSFVPRNAQMEKLPYRDWNSEWRKFFKPLEILKNLWIRPPWETLPAEALGEEIIIDPQMAFGTGHHETTRLMMMAMQKLPLQDKKVLDLGTGSGILAIRARKLGAARVTGIDIDPDAIDNARHNLALNKINQVDFLIGDVSSLEGKTFPIILANIQYPALSAMASQLYRLLENGGTLLVSGLLKTEDTPRLSSVYKQAGLLAVDQITLNEWAAMTWEKSS